MVMEDWWRVLIKGRRLTAGAGSGVMESFQQGRAGTNGVAASQDGGASLHTAPIVGLIITMRIFRGIIGFRHFENLPRLRAGIAVEKKLKLQ